MSGGGSSSFFRQSTPSTSLASSNGTDDSFGNPSTHGSQGERQAKGKWRRAGVASLVSGVLRSRSRAGKGVGKSGSSTKGGIEESVHVGENDISDYREIPAWMFASQPILEAEDKARLSIGTLYVRVVEARNLMSADLNGRSDPYVKLCLSGRYLSHGQEWSEKLRLRKRTRIIKYTLNPVWDEEFSLPVRRAGAVLKLEVWDWDRSSADDALGHLEISIGEELLSQKPIDMWYVLEAPAGMTMANLASKAKAAKEGEERRGSIKTEESGNTSLNPGLESMDTAGVVDDMMDNDANYEEDDSMPDSPGSTTGVDTISVAESDTAIYSNVQARRFGRVSSNTASFSRSGSGGSEAGINGGGGSGKTIFGKKRSGIFSAMDHSHESDEDLLSCSRCLELRRKTFGEVRLELWFQFDSFAETCSHVWSEEPLKPEKIYFSPNQLYRQIMLFWELFIPYFNAMKSADEIMSLTRPWHSLRWLMVIVVMLLYPYLLIVAMHGWLANLVLSAYWKHHCNKSTGGVTDAPDAASAFATAATVDGNNICTSSYELHDHSIISSSSPSSFNVPAAAGSRPSAPRHDGYNDNDGGGRGRCSAGVWGVSTAATKLSASIRTPVVSPTRSEHGGARREEIEAALMDKSTLFSTSTSTRKSRGWSRHGKSRKPNIVDLGPGQRALSEVDPTPSIESSSSLSLPPSGSGASGDGIKFVKSSTAPPRLLAVPEKRTVAAAAAAMTVATTTTTVMATTIAPAARGTGEKLGGREAMGVPSSASALDMRSSGGGGDIGNNDRGSIRARSGSVGSRTAVDRTGGASGGRNKNSAVAWVSSGTARAVATGEGVARGGIGMVVAAGAGGTKVMKQLLPSFVTKDPEIDELSKRLENTKRLPSFLNEVGKRLLGTNGPVWQRQAGNMGMLLINLRRRFHPLTLKHALFMTTALTANMLLQLWMYHTGRFNVYLVMGVLAQFSNKLFKRWGKALLMGIKEAHRCRNIRLSLEAQINVPPVRAGKTPTFAPPGSTPVLPSDPILVIPSVPSSPVLSAKSSPGAFSFASPTRIRRVSVSRSPVLARRAVSREREGGGGLGSGLGSSRSPLRARGGKSVGRGKRRLGMAVELAAGAAAAEKEEEERFPDCSSHDAEKGSVGSGHGDGERRDSKLDSGSTSRRRSLPLSAVWRRSKGGRNDAVLDRRRHTLGSEVSALRGSPVNDSSMASIAFLNGQMPSGPKDSIGEKGTHDCDNRKRETGCLEENGVVMPPSSSTVSRGISLRLGIRRTRRGGGAAVEKAGTPVALTPFSVEQGFRSSGSESGNDLLLPLPPSRAAASKKGDSTRGTGAETAASRYPKRPVPTGGSDNLRRSSIHRHGRGWGSASLVFPLVCGMVAMVVSVLVVAYGRRRWCLGVSC